jgi:ABC-2 type transport system permease protein
MSSTFEAMGQAPSVAKASPAPGVRPFFWSVRRELWEHRSIYMVPAAVGVVVIASVLTAVLRGSRMGWGLALFTRTGAGAGEYLYASDAASGTLFPLLNGTAAITFAGLLTGFFYCLGALNGERRDRSVLFWKSLPVSNATTVASKVFVAMAVLPACVFAAIVITHLAVLAILAASLAVQGQGLDSLKDLPLLRGWLLLAWAAVASSLWWAPLYGWALLVSAWAKRLTLVWAVLPPVGLAVFERVAFGAQRVAAIIYFRLNGGLALTFEYPVPVRPPADGHVRLPDVDPAGFLTSSGLWIGLGFAALCVAGAVWLRRRAEPV